MAERPGGRRPPTERTPSGLEKLPERDRREFAASIARAEFGRFYWSERSERSLREAMARKPKPRS